MSSSPVASPLAGPLTNPAARRWFSDLDALLLQFRELWQIRTFYPRGLCWEASHPDLCAALTALSETRLQQLEDTPALLPQWLGPLLGNSLPGPLSGPLSRPLSRQQAGADLQRLQQLAQVASASQRQLQPPARMDSGIPGRKWQQICAFVAAIAPATGTQLEWCAGKGHLGRLLAAVDSCAVTSLEWQRTLCTQGQALAAQWHLPVSFIEADALAPAAATHLSAHSGAVALHACGDLHTTLMQHWGASTCSQLHLSPCCYPLIRTENYQPLSAPARASALHLSRADLGLAVQETVTAGQHVRRQRDTERLWRLSFDEWQRQWRGSDTYLPLPGFRKQLLSGRFTDFCHWACNNRGLPPPPPIDEQHWLQQGQWRLAQVRRMELISQLFRRPLEIWLALDRVLYLQEQGAEVTLQTFCDKALTPRNLLISARR